MNGKDSVVVDTNVLINLSKGLQSAEEALEGKEVFLSVITCIELLSRPEGDAAYLQWVNSAIDQSTVVELIPSVTRMAISIRKHRRLKLPDAIIAATAAVFDMPLITYDEGFKKISEANVMWLQS